MQPAAGTPRGERCITLESHSSLVTVAAAPCSSPPTMARLQTLYIWFHLWIKDLRDLLQDLHATRRRQFGRVTNAREGEGITDKIKPCSLR